MSETTAAGIPVSADLVMGMNFKVGLFEEPNLFWVVIGIMVALATATLAFAGWRGWL